MDTLGLTLILSTFLGGQETTGPAAGAPADPIRPIGIIYTVNNFGATEPQGCPHKIMHDGGLARRMTAIRQLAASGRPVLIVDGGAALFPEVAKPQDAEREKFFMKGELIIESMSRMGYQAMAVGSTDLLLGLGELGHLASRARFPLLCANLIQPSGAPFKSHTIVEVGGVRVGVIGLIIDSLGKVYLSKVAPGAQVIPSREAARKVVEELKGKTDLIVALAHLSQDSNRELAREVPGIDLIVDPSIEYLNHHPRIKDDAWEEVVGRTAILRADGNGQSLGMVEVDFRKPGAGIGSRSRLEALEAKAAQGALAEEESNELKDLRGRNLYHLRRFALSPHFADEPEAVALLEAVKAGSDVTRVPPRAPASARAEFLTVSGCQDCHARQYEHWKTTKHHDALASVKASGADQLPECISCHTTGYGLAFVRPADAPAFNGIQCESCHGTRPEHPKDPTAHRFGAVAESTCLPCHNEDILKKNFSYFTALKKVRCPTGK